MRFADLREHLINFLKHNKLNGFQVCEKLLLISDTVLFDGQNCIHKLLRFLEPVPFLYVQVICAGVSDGLDQFEQVREHNQSQFLCLFLI